VYRGGAWCWGVAPWAAPRTICPACVRIETHSPAGEVLIEGVHTHEAWAELAQIVELVEAREKAVNPLERIVDIEQTPEGIRVPTTNGRLAQVLGRALRSGDWSRLPHRGPRLRVAVRVFEPARASSRGVLPGPVESDAARCEELSERDRTRDSASNRGCGPDAAPESGMTRPPCVRAARKGRS